jgi:asparagine synthase (glutamine-hydrolysing)
VLGYSYVGPEGSTSDERSYLDDIERACGVRIERLAAAPLLGLMAGAELQAWHAEAPLLDSLWQITHALQHEAASCGARRFLTGHWGDQMLQGTAYLVDLIRGFAWRTAGRHLRAFDEWFQPDEARSLRKQVAWDLLRHHVPATLIPFLKWARRRVSASPRGRSWLSPAFGARALRGASRPAMIGGHLRRAHARSVYLETRMKYAVQCMEWNNKVATLHGLDFAAPFLDRDVIQLVMAMPGEMQAAGGVPRALLREGLAGIVPEAIRRRRWKADFSEPVNQGAARDLAATRVLFSDSPRSVAFGYVNRDRVLAELERLGPRLAGPDCLASWELTDLIGLESWLRVFFVEPRPEGAHEA